MIEKNLKGNHHKLLYYRYRATGVEEPKVRYVGDSEQTYRKKELEKIYIKEDEVRRFSLDKHGQSIPYTEGRMTIISNYILDYWGHFFSAEGVALYAHLRRYCYGEKDYCWPDLNLISMKMNKSRNTIKKILSKLEQYGFVLVFNVQNADKNNMEESPLFKIRNQIPFLPLELYEALPDDLRVDHDKYMQGIVEKFDQFVELDPSISFDDVYDEVISTGTVVRKVKTPLELDKEMKNKIKVLENEITEQDKLVWAQALSTIEKKLSKPSMDTWFKSSFCVKVNWAYVGYSPSNFTAEWLSNRYDKLIREALAEVDSNFESIQYDYLNITRRESKS